MERAIFLDRDGVVNEAILRDGQPYSPSSLKDFVWTKGIEEAVNRFKAVPFRIFVVTNQPDIARKKIKISSVEAISEKIRLTLSIDDILVCPHDDQDHCVCRKPKPGMLVALAEKWRVNLRASFMIGDSWKDMEAGKAAGCRTVLIEKQYNQNVAADIKVKQISEAVDAVINFPYQGAR